MCAIRGGLSRRTSVLVVRSSCHSPVSVSWSEICTCPPLFAGATSEFVVADVSALIQASEMAGEREVAAGSALVFSTIVASGSSIPSLSSLPVWKAAARRLYFDGVLVKRFRQPAENQEAVLARFQELGWAERIDDPLPPGAGPDVRERLRNTVKRLNRQRNSLLLFESDGQGLGIRWRRR